MNAPTLYTCHNCSGPAFGAFCSYACWRIAQGQATDARPPAWSTRMIEAHAAAPKIYAKPNTPKGLVALPTATKADQVDRAAEAAEAAEAIDQAEAKRPECIACDDTGRNSKGGACFPCVRAGRVAADPPPEYSKPIDQVEAVELPPAIAPTNHQVRPAEVGQLSLF